ncbi:PREDICTED: serine beta-lactamase-like protein LACTB, mitochondrial isoform X2 [Poecilia mexicana]|uniref:serine beta-lactamase-like protein LACTB, mitochondrial isoform X2 n=1 Tax=Poecilia mexicana TaxID=48701 RepID=UPI00072E1DBD|nr:PREDICTED: serine beta-lactamase-like protein LACTB, mitochondrial isoform X2 [Poecilia mexicana]
MFRMFLYRRFCAKCSPLPAPRSLLLTPQAKCVFIRTQTRFFVGGNFNFKRRLKSRTWLYGVGAGIVLAVGLKDRSDSANSSCDDKVEIAQKTHPYTEAIEVSRDLLERIKVGKEVEVGAPGLIVGVAVDGVQVWSEGIGYADLENRVPCTPDTVMRIASISKSLTTAAAARLCEEGKLDLDAPVQKYVPEFPQKQFDGKDVTITSRMILSHLSGIRHYEKDAKKVKEDKEKAKRLLKHPGTSKQRDDEKRLPDNRDKPGGDQTSKGKESTQAQRKKEFEHEEYYIKDNYESVTKSLDLFKDDPLIFKPGTTFLYSTHAFTLLSAVLERAANQRFLDIMKDMFRELGMHNTVPDENDPIIYHRSRFYHLNKRGRVVNCPYVDISYKWAGGGFLSTVGDLLLFGNALLYGYQVAHLKDTEGLLPGFLKPKSAIELWTPVDKTEASWDTDGLYGQGWLVVEKLQKYGQCRKRRHYVSHTGGAVGASSVLLVLPSDEMDQRQGRTLYLPQGVVVTIITNMQSVGLNSTALKIAHQFEKARNV